MTASENTPRILAPAGNRDAFLAAIAAGADAIYCGLKAFSARMEAKNFQSSELLQLISLAHEHGVDVYVTLNSLVKPDDCDELRRLVRQLNGKHQPDAFIVQDLAVIRIVQDAGYTGEIHLSTLANVTFPDALEAAGTLPGVRRIVLPRELSIDEIKEMAAASPDNVDLEVFIHGALCYAVSGRCYWSSYMGGKSGLRGRCVQPCRRVYSQGKAKGRAFSCQDLSLDTLVKVLKDVPKVTTWKIEGRKKSPHYVYYTVQAYRLLRDEFKDTQSKKDALSLLEMALGRKGTHYNFLPQRPRNPLEQGRDTGSGFQVGTVKGTVKRPFITPRIALLNGDAIRIGYEDQPWHQIIRLKKAVPKNGQFFLNFGKGKGANKGTPVFLTDRREQALTGYIAELAAEIKPIKTAAVEPKRHPERKPFKNQDVRRGKIHSYTVYRSPARKSLRGVSGFWMSEDNCKHLPSGGQRSHWMWLPPVIWPYSQKSICSQIDLALNKGIRLFVLNAPWQVALFNDKKNLTLWAGPFCNIANPVAVDVLKRMGFAGAFISPELGRSDVLALPGASSLPLGIVIAGNWPLCISRIAPENVKLGEPFQSPKGEQAWLRKYDDNFWMYPNWSVDLSREQDALKQAGYRMLVTLAEPIPKQVRMKDRPGLWNWKHGLM
jgi:putative protease